MLRGNQKGKKEKITAWGKGIALLTKGGGRTTSFRFGGLLQVKGTKGAALKYPQKGKESPSKRGNRRHRKPYRRERKKKPYKIAAREEVAVLRVPPMGNLERQPASTSTKRIH